MIIDTLETRQWVSHQARARAENIQCWQDPTAPGDDATFTALSGSVEGLLYTVHARVTTQGRDLLCDCEAGQVGVLCKHLYVVAKALQWLDPLAIEGEAARIKLYSQQERSLSLAQRKLQRAQQREASRSAAQTRQKAINALYVGCWVRINQRGVPLHMQAWKGAEAVVEGVFPRGVIRISLPATEDRPVRTVYVSASLVKRIDPPSPQAEEASRHDEVRERNV
jgi:hypothetical protein